MDPPDYCVTHDRKITPESWGLWQRAVELGNFADYCACDITQQELWDLNYVKLCNEREALKAPRTKAVGNIDSDEEYWFFITITQPDTNKDLDRIIKVTNKFIKSKQIEMIEYAYCLELTKTGTPHSHIRCKTHRKYLDAPKLKKLNDNYRIEIARETYGSNDYISDTNKSHPPVKWFYCSDNYSGTKVAE